MKLAVASDQPSHGTEPDARRGWRRGKRTVLLTYPGLRLGNYLYFVLHAFLETRAGRDYRVLDTGLGDEWYACFPGLDGYTVNRLRTFDRREHIPPLFYQCYGSDFTAENLERFIRTVLKPKLPHPPPPETVTVNARRGDYYESPERKATFGIDAPAYLRSALELAEARQPVNALRLISDDNEWAADELSTARADLPVSEVVPGPPTDQLMSLASSPRLILANSTFSYWGAYVSEVFHGPKAVEIYAPAVHSRAINGGLPWQHAPSWTAVSARPAADG